MYTLINSLIVLAMIFFFFLPITDYKTARMKLCVVCALAVVLTVSATSIRTHPSPASIMASRG
jgi:uncharacterized membrane protein